MDYQSLHSQVEQVQSLLENLQTSTVRLEPDQLDRISDQLNGVAANLLQVVDGRGRQNQPPERAQSDAEHSVSAPESFGAGEPWLGLALRQAKCGAWKWDLMNHTMHWSPELNALMGFDLNAKSMHLQDFFDLVHPENRAEAQKVVEKALQRGGPFYMEFRTFHADGREMWVSSTGTVDLDADGRPTQAAGISQEISERKAAEEALRASEERERARVIELEALMDAVPAIIWIARDPECQEMVGNRSGYEFLNMGMQDNLSKTAPEEELSKQHYRNFKDGREILGGDMPMQIAAKTGVGTSNFEFDLVFDSGETKHMLGNVVPLADAAGKPTGAVGAFVDITERKHMEEELRQSEARLRKWSEQLTMWSKTLNAFFWVLSPDGHLITPGLVQPYYTGKKFDELMGMNWLDVFHPDDREMIRRQLETSYQEQKPFMIEARIWSQEKQGYLWYIHRAVPTIEDGKMTGWVGASNDVQARREAMQALEETKEALRRSEEQEHARANELQAIIDAVPTPILLTRHPEGREISGNRAAYEFLRMEPGGNIASYVVGSSGSHVVKIQGENHAERSEIPLRAALKTGQPITGYEGWVTFDDGSERVLFGSAIPLFDAAGKPGGAVGVFMDITQRIAAERALAESEQRFKIALASAPIAVFSLDRDLRYSWLYNPRHDLEVESLLGKRGDEILPAEDVAEFTEAKQQVIETGEPVQREVKVRIKGEWTNHLVSLAPTFDRQGRVSGMIGSTMEITEQRRLEAAQRENEIHLEAQRRLMEYRESERVKIAREIHDGPVQTLVATIFNVHGMITGGTDPAVLPGIEEIHTNLKNAVQELRLVINELRPPSLVRFGLSRAIQKHAEMVQEKCPELDLRLSLCENLNALPEQVTLPLYRICQEALNNIARHAGATHAEAVLQCVGSQILIRIQDDGVGLTKGIDYARLAQSSHFGMLGMKERAEALGGTFQVASQPGKGTKIEIVLPIQREVA